ncbi:hypothetical protein [Algoriphagus aquimarinus]|uniref:Uncharacterized protein n=1 Tax=Algoriphagus aquimarinus TaxID=237018 RepID=A0A5C7ABH8_9BACT|nr:hypothetical protein [Algoriphagus aquimarinus]TXE05761.1 hypothetical protein ESV85_17665 [Algoriphagus aquimarinus]
MQKAKSILAFGLLVVLLNSCVYSLFPIYTDDTLVYFPELIGRWEMDDEDYIEFSNASSGPSFFGSSSESTDLSKNKAYSIEIMDGEELMAFVGHIAKIGNDLFLDLYPDDPYSNGSTLSNVIPVHTFVKLKFSGKQLYLTSFDLEKLNKLFESNLIRLRHENVDGTILITAQPKEIQKFIDRYSDDESVFEETEKYKRAS